jgi:hypothetical protein
MHVGNKPAGIEPVEKALQTQFSVFCRMYDYFSAPYCNINLVAGRSPDIVPCYSTASIRINGQTIFQYDTIRYIGDGKFTNLLIMQSIFSYVNVTNNAGLLPPNSTRLN